MDKPSKEEWSVCAGMALQLAAEDAPSSLRRRYFAYMRKLRQKYPESVDVLASIADVYTYHEPAVKLLLETYRLAERNRDYRNLTYIADSLAWRFLCRRQTDTRQALAWVRILARNLQNYSDQDSQDALKWYCKLLEIDPGSLLKP